MGDEDRGRRGGDVEQGAATIDSEEVDRRVQKAVAQAVAAARNEMEEQQELLNSRWKRVPAELQAMAIAALLGFLVLACTMLWLDWAMAASSDCTLSLVIGQNMTDDFATSASQVVQWNISNGSYLGIGIVSGMSLLVAVIRPSSCVFAVAGFSILLCAGVRGFLAFNSECKLDVESVLPVSFVLFVDSLLVPILQLGVMAWAWRHTSSSNSAAILPV
eukprot:FR735005.1.p1 GENE.FR735005.1~~FR735005.1.p1  ORF type:complete len:228 (+),score=18.46 FR735005.1:32-685(+)